MSKNKSTLESVLFFVFFYEKCLFFPGGEKISKKVAGDNYCGCVPYPAALWGVERQDALRCSALMCK